MGVIDIVAYRKTARGYITYDVPIEPRKTRRGPHEDSILSIVTFGSPASKQRGGAEGQHERLLFCSEDL